MSNSFVVVDGQLRVYVGGASSNEDCHSLARYFQKYWDASCNLEYDIGSDAKYTIWVLGFCIQLVHESHLGNYLTCFEKPIDVILQKPLADLESKLGN